ncbi:MAG: fumarylacetoacetase [Chlamydiales bacterium]|nr:fumarylacetoacetase [Chlamydiales bacterium]
MESANDPNCDFPVANLPYGVFSHKSCPEDRRIGVAIGDKILDLRAISQAHPSLFAERAPVEDASLKTLMSLGFEQRSAIRTTIRSLLIAGSSYNVEPFLVDMHDTQMHLPLDVGDYTDFYTSLDHATNVSRLFRPDSPQPPPNFYTMPLGYHGRASSIVVSGTSLVRPNGQILGPNGPLYGAIERLDYEMELGVFIAEGNEQGSAIDIADAPSKLFGMVILNDWSGRDVQKWEYVPLGPFNAKNFATSISPWVVTMEALEPYRVAGPQDPGSILPYLRPNVETAFDINVEVFVSSEAMREKGIAPTLISRGNFSTMYWTLAQMLTHHTSTGCNMRPGDLIGSGTISGPTRDSRGCLLEFLLPDGEPIILADRTTRQFLQDGDEVILKAHAHKQGFPRIGFGECRGVVLPAKKALSATELSSARHEQLD